MNMSAMRILHYNLIGKGGLDLDFILNQEGDNC
jgi:hypothetical protein